MNDVIHIKYDVFLPQFAYAPSDTKSKIRTYWPLHVEKLERYFF